MAKVIDITGQRYGRLTVLSMVAAKGNARALCRCDCGKETTPLAYNLKNGGTVSCGCLATEQKAIRAREIGHANRSHGMSGTRTYVCWQEAKKRCHLPTHTRYPEYGARGVAVCERWRNSFEAFLADLGECPPAMTLERLDNAKGYEPGNCEWATRERQAQHRDWNKANPDKVRSMRVQADAGQSIASLAREYGMSETNARLIANRQTWKNVQ